MRKILVSLFFLFSFTYTHALGIIDSTSLTQYSGWGCDPPLPGQQFAIQAWRDDGKLIGTTIASLPREQAVGTACNSPHSAHGFVLVVQNDPSLLDNKWHDVRLVTAGPNSTVVPLNNSPVRIFFEGQPNNSLPPANPGDVVARDLDSQVFSDLGHIGIWDGSYQAEEILFSDRKFVRFEGALPLARVRKVACSAFYEVEDFWETLAGRYFFSLLRDRDVERWHQQQFCEHELLGGFQASPKDLGLNPGKLL